MSTFQLEITCCTCHDLPVEQCKHPTGTYEVLYPKEEDVNVLGVFIGGTKRTG